MRRAPPPPAVCRAWHVRTREGASSACGPGEQDGVRRVEFTTESGGASVVGAGRWLSWGAFSDFWWKSGSACWLGGGRDLSSLISAASVSLCCLYSYGLPLSAVCVDPLSVCVNAEPDAVIDVVVSMVVCILSRNVISWRKRTRGDPSSRTTWLPTGPDTLVIRRFTLYFTERIPAPR